MNNRTFSFCLISALIFAALIAGLMIGSHITSAAAEREFTRISAELDAARKLNAGLTAELVGRDEQMIAWNGLASWYGREHHGRRTASGERFDQTAMTAAHRSLPFGTLVLVLDPARHTWALVRINDRGPASWTGRDIDLSRAAARQIGMERDGVVPVVMMTMGKISEED